MQAIPRSQTVYIPLPQSLSPGAKVNLPDVPELRQGIVAVGFETVTSDLLAFAPDGTQVVTAGDLANLSLVLLDKSTQRHRNVPMLSLYTGFTFGVWKEVVPFLPNWQGSWLVSGGSFTGGTVVPLVVYYKETAGR